MNYNGGISGTDCVLAARNNAVRDGVIGSLLLLTVIGADCVNDDVVVAPPYAYDDDDGSDAAANTPSAGVGATTANGGGGGGAVRMSRDVVAITNNIASSVLTHVTKYS
jgi:hypothetical protein